MAFLRKDWDWLWQKLRLNKPEKRAAEDSERLKRIEDILIGRARAQNAFLPGGDQPGAKQAEAIIEQDIGAAISSLAKAGKIEAVEAAERGDTKAADDALSAKIAKIERSRLGAAKEEAKLYRQRGGLAYTDDTQTALHFYAKAAEIDPEDIEALFSLAQLQVRAGYRLAPKQILGRLIALGNRIEDEQQRHRAHVVPVDVEAALGDRNAASGRYERADTVVHDLIQRDPNNAEFQRVLSASHVSAGDISAGGQDRDGALIAYSDGLEIAKKLAALDPNNAEWQHDLLVSYNLIGEISAARGDRGEAIKAYQDGLDIAKALAERDPDNVDWQKELAISNERLGDIFENDGKPAKAVAAFENALTIYTALITRFDGHEARVNMVAPLWRLACLKGKDGKADLQRARDVLVELRDENRLDAMRIGWIPEIEAEIAALQGEGRLRRRA
jgi:tetratricopeptide (TPR) repeat protein